MDYQCTRWGGGRRKSSIQLHNIFLINVGPVIIAAVACRLTGCRPVETQCLEVSPFCSHSIYTPQRPRQWSYLGVTSLNTRFLLSFLGVFAYKKMLGRTEKLTRERKE